MGTGLLFLSVALAAFGTVAWLAGHGGTGFLTTATASAPVGWLLFRLGSAEGEPSRREALLSVLLLWLIIPVVGTWPYVADGGMTVADALFESMSGFTATGATALSDFGAFGPELFLWRAFSQWVGGIGIIVLVIAVFPQLAIAGRQLFFTETPGPTEHRLTPRLRNTASAVIVVYAGLTVAAVVAYLASGLGPYDAVAHAMTTVAAAGFSPEARSFEGFGAGTQWVAIVFMTLAGSSFALQSRALAGRPRALVNDAEFRTYLGIAVAGGLTLAWLVRDQTASGLDAVRHGLFQSLSILTTTGYASTDYAAWSSSAQAILVLLMFVGGSAGSAAGGIKVVRLLIAGKNTAREVRRALHPRAVLPLRVGARTVPDEVLRAVAAFITLYVTLFVVIATVLALQGLDFTTSLTAAIATLGNVGPGLGMVGPMASYGELPTASKLLLTFAMYAGRLEVVAVFVVFTPDWWKVPRGVRSRVWSWATGRRPD